jgi:hypothetical protein
MSVVSPFSFPYVARILIVMAWSIEKAILVASGDQRKTLIKEISLPRADGMNPMITMIKDQFASECLINL